jgi:hypothetical protein
VTAINPDLQGDGSEGGRARGDGYEPHRMKQLVVMVVLEWAWRGLSKL